MHLVPGAILCGKYKLVRALASGGMGCIWSAQHETLGTKLAVKFIHPVHVGSTHLRDRFAREAVAVAKVSSAHVVQVFDYGVEDDTPYLVMELLEGEDLGTRLKREGCLSLEAASNLLIQVAKGLRRAHAAGIIHRDLKPANIFIARDMDEEVVKILDFGIAKLASSPETTGTGVLVGSPLYMSPEQIRQLRTIDHRSDLWSLAVIMFRAITGKTPFPGEDKATVMIEIMGRSLPVPSDIDPSLPPALDAFFQRAFQREPSDRYQSARELTDAFVEAALGEPPSGSSWSVVGLSLKAIDFNPIPVRCTDRPPPNDPATTLVAPVPAPDSASEKQAAPVTTASTTPAAPCVKTLPSVVHPVELPVTPAPTPTPERPKPAPRATRTGATDAPKVAKSRRKASVSVPWPLLGLSALCGVALGWQYLLSPATASERWSKSVSSAAALGSSAVQSISEARDHIFERAKSASAPPSAEAAPALLARPLEEAQSVIVNDSVPASLSTPEEEPATARRAARWRR